jgi:hypothetical protein
LSPLKLVAATRPGAFGVRPAPGEVDGDDEFPIANDNDQQHAVNA